MKDVWFTSDTHFGHSNIVKYSARPFLNDAGEIDIEAHDHQLVHNWNNLVKPKDDVFFLGDFCYRNKEGAEHIREKLNGTIYFIEGNHDSSAFQIRNSFAWYKNLHAVKVNGQEIVLCHYAMRVWNKSHHGVWHLYGHSHNSLPDISTSLSFDVGVDATAMRLSGKVQGEPCGGCRPEDYRPLHFDEVAKIMGTKVFQPIDHHGKREDVQQKAT
jgi:calcineurin-like phosphoesterase family protein